jgi:ribulose-5-phosphate 4-epimerase/fuculose-1-phosphate aldolase
MVRVDEKGNRVDGADKPVNAAGFMIHSAIHKRRPDIHAACHMHSPYGRAWSTFGKGIEMLNQGTVQCPIYHRHLCLSAAHSPRPNLYFSS